MKTYSHIHFENGLDERRLSRLALCGGAQINSSKGLPKSSWAHLPDNEKSKPMENTWVMSMVVWKDALEVFGNDDFPHRRVERSAGETILYSSSRSST
jgi:hypothetical protein